LVVVWCGVVMVVVVIINGYGWIGWCDGGAMVDGVGW
jgi:hypothetical protein